MTNVLAFSSNLSLEPYDYGVGNDEEKSLKINHLDPARLRLAACREPQLCFAVVWVPNIMTQLA